MTSRNPIEFTDVQKRRVGNKVLLSDVSGNPVTADNPQYVQIQGADSPSVDAFGRLRFAEPFTIFDSKQINDNQPLFWDDQEVSGSGTGSTYNTNQASTTIDVSNTTAGKRVRQTFRRFNYQPGKSQLVFMTFAGFEAETGIIKEVGYFDDNNGIFLRSNGTTILVVKRSYTSGAAVDTVVNQGNWNLDKFNGTGASGITLDFSKTQILVIDFEWLGVGRIRIGFNVDGITHYCHEYLNSNNLSVVYMSTPNLPLRYSIENDGTGAAAEFTHICSSVESEGGLEFNGFNLSIDRGITPLITLNDTGIYPLLAIRLKSSYQGITINVFNINILTTTTANYRWSILLNPTITGTALSFASIANSAIEAQVNTTNATKVTAGTGIKLAAGYISSTNQSAPIAQEILIEILSHGPGIPAIVTDKKPSHRRYNTSR